MIVQTLRARDLFAQLADMEENLFPLDRAALAIALEEYPDLNVESYLRMLDDLAARAEELLGSNRSPMAVLEVLNDLLFAQEGFQGNSEDYYDPRNSFLNDVLERKLGIPISLSVIYMEVARRLNFEVQGVGFPGHFIVKYGAPEREILIDPFNKGRFLTLKDCQEFLDKVYGGKVTMQPSFLQAMNRKAVLARMLYNLKGIYFEKNDPQKALAIVERIVLINPGDLSEVRDRGLLYMQISLFSKALADLSLYKASACTPDEVSDIEGHIRTLRRIVTSPN